MLDSPVNKSNSRTKGWYIVILQHRLYRYGKKRERVTLFSYDEAAQSLSMPPILFSSLRKKISLINPVDTLTELARFATPRYLTDQRHSDPMSAANLEFHQIELDLGRDTVVASAVEDSLSTSASCESLILTSEGAWLFTTTQLTLAGRTTDIEETAELCTDVVQVFDWLKARNALTCRYWPAILDEYPTLRDVRDLAIKAKIFDKEGSHPGHFQEPEKQTIPIPQRLPVRLSNSTEERYKNLLITTPEAAYWTSAKVGLAIDSKHEAVRQTETWKSVQAHNRREREEREAELQRKRKNR